MRAALISLAEQPRLASGESITLAGKTLARRQLDFAVAAGCERIVALGDGNAPEAIALRHAAEAGGARFQAVENAHGLLGAIRATDELLVLAPGLVAEEEPPRGSGSGVFVLPAQPAVNAGFERIDLERAWAGMLVVNGGAVERLAELPPDSEPTAALLRIALQAGVPERRMAEDVLARGTWSLASTSDDPAVRDSDWLKRNKTPLARYALSGRIADLLLAAFTIPLLRARRSLAWLAGAAITLLMAATGAAWFGNDVAAFALVALGAVAAASLARLEELRNAPLGSARRGAERLLASLTDLAFAGCAVLSIEGVWLNRLFPPLALLAVLHACGLNREISAMALAGDRVVLALALTVAAAFGVVEPAVMALVLIVLAPAVARSAAKRG